MSELIMSVDLGQVRTMAWNGVTEYGMITESDLVLRAIWGSDRPAFGGDEWNYIGKYHIDFCCELT